MSTPPANSRGSREEGAAPPLPLPPLPPLPPPLVPPPPDTAGASVDTDNPWLGLASFTEATRAFFFGREQEITELERRVQRKLLTVLFGKSGLGKTSILQAGLVPGLRARGYFPVYLRIDYGHDSPEASEQIKQAINRAAAVRAGERGERGERGESAGAAGEEAAAQGTTAEATAAEEGAAQGVGQGPAAEGAAQGSNGQVAAGQGAVGQGRLGHGAAAPAIDPEESIWEFLHHREGAQSSGAVPGDVSAATRTVKSPATQTTAAAPFTALAPTEPLQTPSPSVPRMPPTLHTATALLPPVAPAAPAAPLGATASTVPLGATAPPIATAPLRATAPPTSTPAITAIPLLIFDQFEELFTLAQSDEFGRARAARFVEELADLVENRPPKALEAKLDSDDSLSERFDFARSDYRVVISLREDYLAPLESLKKQMPSLSQNRLRLAPMTGAQALEAVLLPGQRLAEDSVLPGQRRGAGAAQVSGRPLEAGGQLGAGAAGPPGAGRPLEPETAQVSGRSLRPGRALVSQEVAEAIVRFVAGGAELANAEVEPSLLSLICRELNEQRLAQHHSEISLGLLAGSRESILGSFYERALADQPPAVRSLIEDELLTESGYRENLAEESLLRKLQTAGAAPDALAKLVNRRLLRIEERLDVRRVELTHDVLTGVVKASRDQRHEREARAATERLLAEQAARESAARRALRRARAIAAGCTALAVAAVIAALFAVINVQRARHAEADARQTRAVSEQARLQAEGLLGFLTDDFVGELETFGRYQTIADLSQREIDYFEALPAQLKDPASIRNGVLALANHAQALQFVGDQKAAARSAAAAVALAEPLWRTDKSAATAVALGRAYTVQGMVLYSAENFVEADIALRQAAALLRPVADRPGAAVEPGRAYLDALVYLEMEEGDSRSQPERFAQAVREAVRVATRLEATVHGDAIVDDLYAHAQAGLASLLVRAGQDQAGRRAGEDALALADRLLAQRPQYGRALVAKVFAARVTTVTAMDELDSAAAVQLAMQAVQAALALSRLEPANVVYDNQLGLVYATVAQSLWNEGRLREATGYDRKALDVFGATSAGFSFGRSNLAMTMATAADRQAQLGNAAGVAATAAAADAFLRPQPLHGHGAAGSDVEAAIDALRIYPSAVLAYERDDFGAARRIAHGALMQLASARSMSPVQPDFTVNFALWRLATIEGQAEYRLGDFAAAAAAQSVALQAARAADPESKIAQSQRRAAQSATWLSMALAGEGKRAQATQTIGPVVAMYRALAARNHGDQWLPLELAGVLYAQSRTDDVQRAALLREAAGLIEHLTPGIAALHDTREWRARIEAAQRGSAAPHDPTARHDPMAQSSP